MSPFPRHPFTRGPGLPAEVRAELPRRPLASAQAEDGAWLVGTRDALHAFGEGGSGEAVRWERVQRADWDRESSTLRVEEIQEYGEPVRASAYVLEEPGGLLSLVWERVSASIVLQRRVDVEKKRGFTVIGRRPPSGHGEVTWAFEFDAGVDPEDPEVKVAADAALREAAESLGL
jgi:hypothetical protein